MLISENRSKDSSGNRVANYRFLNLNSDLKENVLGIRKPQNIIIKDRILFITKENELICQHIENFFTLWKTFLFPFGQIRKILGVAEELLWISCMSSDVNRNTKAHLIALELKTGKIIHHLSDGLPLHEVHVELLEDKQRIVSIWGKMSSHGPAESPFVEINALTGEVLRNTYSQSMYNTNLKLGAWKYLNDKIYFDAAFDTINSTHIGVMDYLTLEVEWFTEVIDRKAGLRNLQVTEDKIYIMDSGNQLFVYEKE